MPRKTTKRAGAGKRKDSSADNDDTQMTLPMPAERDRKHFISEWQLQSERVRKEKKALSKIEKAANDAGVSVPSIKKALQMKAVNPIQLKSDLMQLCMTMEDLGLPVRLQVFEAKYDGPEAEAKVKGFQDGKGGKDRNYGAWLKGSPARRAYDEGYDEAQIENMPISETAKAEARAKLQSGEGARA